MSSRISFIPNHFNRNRHENRFVPVTFEFVTIWTKMCPNLFGKKNLKKTMSCDRGHKFKIFTFCDRHKCHTLRLVQTLFLFLFGIRIGTAFRNPVWDLGVLWLKLPFALLMWLSLNTLSHTARCRVYPPLAIMMFAACPCCLACVFCACGV